MNTTNASSFFQSADAQANFDRQSAKAANKLGNPIQLSTKILHVSNDMDSTHHVLLAESGSISRRVNIETGTTEAIYRGHSAPVTTVIDLGNGTLASGSWDKTIRVFDKKSKTCLRVLNGHTDFIKCLLHVPSMGLLLSGSSDSHIRVWSLSTFECLYILKGHARGVESLALGPNDIVYSGGSESAIRRWLISVKEGRETGEVSWLHQTSVYSLLYDHDTESLWTASADRTARQLSITADTDADAAKLVEESHFDHPDYVRDVVVHHSWVITACRDEDVRIFDIGSGKLLYRLEGHFTEVSGLCVAGNALISVSLDATLRRWSLTEAGLLAHVKEQESWKPTAVLEEEEKTGMTAEELAELEELMSDE